MRIVQLLWLSVVMLVMMTCTNCTKIDASEHHWLTLRGQVIAGPTCPAQINMAECMDQPVENALLLVLDSQGHEIAQVKSDKRGQFFIKLPFGKYYLLPKPLSGLTGTPERLEVIVNRVELTPVIIKYDTGIRSISPPQSPN